MTVRSVMSWPYMIMTGVSLWPTWIVFQELYTGGRVFPPVVLQLWFLAGFCFVQFFWWRKRQRLQRIKELLSLNQQVQATISRVTTNRWSSLEIGSVEYHPTNVRVVGINPLTSNQYTYYSDTLWNAVPKTITDGTPAIVYIGDRGPKDYFVDIGLAEILI